MDFLADIDISPCRSTRSGKTSPITKSPKITDLRVICKKFGLSTSGTKKMILTRLYNHGALRPTEQTPQKLPQNDGISKASKKGDLENACRQLNLKTSGNKDDLIRRLKYYKKKSESIKQNEDDAKRAESSFSHGGSSKQYSDYEVIRANARMSVKPPKFPKRNSGTVLQINHSIVDIINLIEKPKHGFSEEVVEVSDSEKAGFFSSLNMKPVFHPNTVIQVDSDDETEKNDVDIDDFTDPLADVTVLSEGTDVSNEAVDCIEEKTVENEAVDCIEDEKFDENDFIEEKIDENENFAVNDFTDPLEVEDLSSAITRVTDTFDKYDLTFLTDSGIDEESNSNDSSDDEGIADIDVDDLSMKKVIEFVEDAIENIVAVGAEKEGGDDIMKKSEEKGSGLFFAWGSFVDESGSPEKIKFIV